MNLQSNWETPIGFDNFRSVVQSELLLDEVMQHPDLMKEIKVGSLRISDRKEEFPNCVKFIEDRLIPRVKTYMREGYQYEVKSLSWSSWVHTCFHGTGLVPHYHMGDEHLTSILYLTDSKANLILRDPRANTVRNWPQSIIKTHFSDQQVAPTEGDFVIFPTYIDHYVMAAEPDMRVSIAIDWCLGYEF